MEFLQSFCFTLSHLCIYWQICQFDYCISHDRIKFVKSLRFFFSITLTEYITHWIKRIKFQTFLIPLSRYICLSVCLIIFHPSFFHPLCMLFPFIFAHISVFAEHIIRPTDCILYHLSLHRAYLWDIFIPNDGHYKNFIIFLQAKPS